MMIKCVNVAYDGVASVTPFKYRDVMLCGNIIFRSVSKLYADHRLEGDM